MLPRLLLAALLVPALAACGGGSGPQSPGAKPPPAKAGAVKPPLTKPDASKPSANRPGTTRPRPALTAPRQPDRAPLPTARPLALPGLEGVIGASSAELGRQFGKPRLEVIEGDARKLQFSGRACVLDIYLYPTVPGREPIATHVDARRASDGQDVDRAACVAALRAR